MNTNEYRFLLSERATLKDMIAQAPKGSVITKMGLASQLRQVEEKLESYEGYSPRVVNAQLTFRGKPVMGNRAIHASFGLGAAKAFVDAVVEVGRGWGGKVEDYGLLVTGTAHGSFGFEVEDAAQTPPLVGESTPVEEAMKKVKDILRATTGTDEQLSEAIEDTDDDALDAIRDFLNTVAGSEAICALALQGDQVSFDSPDQVQRGADRLDCKNITVEDIELVGYIQGFMPKGRRAEFVVKETGDIITARVLASPAETLLTAEMVNAPLRATARARRVGDSNPTYTITAYEVARVVNRLGFL